MSDLYVIPPSGTVQHADGRITGPYRVAEYKPEVYGDYRDKGYLGKDGKITDWANSAVFETIEKAEEAIKGYKI